MPVSWILMLPEAICHINHLFHKPLEGFLPVKKVSVGNVCFGMLCSCVQVEGNHFGIKITHPGQFKLFVLGLVFHIPSLSW